MSKGSNEELVTIEIAQKTDSIVNNWIFSAISTTGYIAIIAVIILQYFNATFVLAK
jgi:hypothetical protein